MAELKVRTDLSRSTLVVDETLDRGRASAAPSFMVYARVSRPPADGRLALDLPEGLYLPDEDRGDRMANEGLEVGWSVAATPGIEPSRTTVAVRLFSHKHSVASTQVPVGIAVEGHGSFDPERDAFRFAATPHCFGSPRPTRAVFDATFRFGIRTPLRGRLYQGLYRRLFTHGLSSGMARAALALSARGYQVATAERRLLDKESRELVQIMHGRQLGDRNVGALRAWMQRPSPDGVFELVRGDLRSRLPQRYAIDIGLPRVSRWDVFGALAQPHATVVPYRYRISPERSAVVEVYDPAHPDDFDDNRLVIDLALGRYEYRDWASEGASGPTILAAIALEPLTVRQSAFEAGVAQVLGVA